MLRRGLVDKGVAVWAQQDEVVECDEFLGRNFRVELSPS